MRSLEELVQSRKKSGRSLDDLLYERTGKTFEEIKADRNITNKVEPVQQNQAVLDAVQLVNSNAAKRTSITDEDRTANNNSILNQLPKNSYDSLAKAYKNGGDIGVKFSLIEDYGMDENKATDIANRWRSDFEVAKNSEKAIENKKAADNWYAEKNKTYESMTAEVKKIAEETYKRYTSQRPQTANSGLAKLKELGYNPTDIMEYMSRKEARANNAAMLDRVDNASGARNVAQNIASVGATLAQPLDVIGQTMSTFSNIPYDPATARFTNYKEAVRNETSDRIIEANGEGTKGQALNFVYQTGMSMLDSGLAMGVGALTGTEAASLGLMSMGAASSAYNDAIKRGADKNQALATAFANGAFEALFEKVSLDNLWSMAKPQARTAVKDVLKEIAIQAGIEGSEEVFTSIADALADEVINGNQSAYQQSINDYMLQGMSRTDAEARARKDFILSLATDFAGGAISGGVFGAVGTTISNHRYNKLLENASEETVSKLYDTSKNAAEGTTAKEIADSVDDATKLSDTQKREMLQSLVDQQMEEMNNVLYAELQQNIKDTDTLDKAQKLLAEYADSNMTNEQFETKLANEVAKNSTERNAILEVRDNLTNGTYEANMPITTALNEVSKDNVKAETNKRIIKNDNAVEKQYSKFVEARNKGKENYYSKAKGITAITVNRNQDGENYADVTKAIGILRTGSKALLQLEGGRDARFEDIDFHDETMGELYNEAVSLPDWKLANIAVQGYSGQLNVKGYVKALKIAYDAGAIDTRSGLSSKDLLNQEQFKILREIVDNDALIMQAYYRGQNEAKAKATPKVSNRVSNQHRSNAEEFENSESKLKTVLSFVAETFDMKVVEADRLSDNNGRLRSDILGYYFNNMLALNNNGESNELQTAFHEIMEKVKNEDRENYEFIASNVLAYLQSEKGSQFLSEELTRYQNKYATIEGRSRIENIADEYVNDFISGIFTNEEGINSFATWAAAKNNMKKQTVFEKIKNFFDTLVAELKTYMSKNSNMKDAARVGFEATGKQIDDIRQMVLKEFDKLSNQQSNEFEEDIDSENTEDIKPSRANEAASKEVATKAEEHFGTTQEWERAAYLDVNGKLLDFYKGEEDLRDSADIAEIVEGGKNEFISEGNVEVLSYGIKLAARPNELQKEMLHDYFEKLEGQVFIYFLNSKGESTSEIDYDKGTDIDTIIRTIDKHYDKALQKELEEKANQQSQNKNKKAKKAFSMTVDSDGIEEYIFNKKLKDKSFKEKADIVLNDLLLLYESTPIKFTRNGHDYYAFMDEVSLRKNLYGDNNSSQKGIKTKTNILADSNLIELSENALYLNSSPENKKNQNKNHKKTESWDYFYKLIKVDNKYFDVLINVKKDIKKNRFVYELQLKETPMLRKHLSSNNANIGVLADIISDNEAKVKFTKKRIKNGKMFSLSEQDAEIDEIDKPYLFDSEGTELTEQQQEFFGNSQAVDDEGRLLVLYHQTSEDFTIFDTKLKGAGHSDYLTPYGIFLKPNSKDIGLKGKKQMPLYANIRKMLTVTNRNELERILKNDPEIKADIMDLEAIDTKYSKLNEEANKAFTEYVTTHKNPDGSRLSWEDEGLRKLIENEEDIVEEWGDKYDEKAESIKQKTTDYIKSLGYDGIHLKNDAGSFGRTIETYIAFESNQVKRIDNHNPTMDDDIRFSLDIDNITTSDSEGNELTEQQQEFFSESKERDLQGKLRVMYHGSRTGGFTIFDRKKTSHSNLYGRGFYFTNSDSHASQYGSSDNTYKVYLNIVNPVNTEEKTITKEQLRKFVQTVADDEDYGIENYGYGATVNSIVNELYKKKNDFTIIEDVSATCIGDMVAATKIFNEVNGTNFDGFILNTESVCFYPEQIKLTTNENPTNNPDIRYSLQIPEYTLSDTYDFEYTDDADMEAREKEIERQENNIKEFWKNIITNEKFTALRFEKGAEWRKGNPIKYILHPSTRYGVKYQLSYYDNDGAIGHYNYYPEDMDKLYNDLMVETLYEKNREVEIYPPEAEKSFSLNDVSDEEWEDAINENDNLRKEAARYNKDWKKDLPDELKNNDTYDEFILQNRWLREYIDNYSDTEEYKEPAEKILKQQAIEETRKSTKEYFESIEDIEGEDTTDLLVRLSQESDWNVRPAEALKAIEEAVIYASTNIDKFSYTDKDISRIALKLKKGTNLKVETIEQALKGVFDDLIKGELNHNQVMNIAEKVGRPVIEHTIDERYKSEWSEIREKLKGIRIRFSDEQIKEINYHYNGNSDTTPYNYYRKSLFGLITITKDEKIAALDMSTWEDLCDVLDMPIDTKAEDMPMVLKETLDGLQTGYKTYDATKKGFEIEEMAYDKALDILQDFFSMQSVNNKQQANLAKTIGKIKVQQQQYRRKAYERYQAELAKQRRLLAQEKKNTIRQLARELQELDAEELKALEQSDELTAALVTAEKTKAQRKLEKVQKQNNERIAEIKARNFDSIARQKELRDRTVLREQLRKKVDKLNSMLKSPKVTASVKANLVMPTIQMLEAINLDTGKSEVFKDKLARLSDLYDRYKSDSNFTIDYDENTAAMIHQIEAIFEGRTYLDFSNKELIDVLEIVNRLQKQIQNAGKLLQNEKYQDAIQTSREIIYEINAAKGSTQTKASQAVDSFFSNQINAERWFRKTSGYKDGAFMSLYKQLDKGQLDMIAMQKEVNDMFAPLLEGKENQENVKRLFSTDDKDMVDIGLKVDGKPVKVTRDMMLSFLLHVQNADNARHLILGGFTIPNMEEYKKGNYKLAYQGARIGNFYTVDDIQAAADAIKTKNSKATFDDGIIAMAKVLEGRAKQFAEKELTKWEKEYLSTAENLFHNYLGQKINAVTIETRGYALAQTKNYYPIKTDPNFTHTDFAALKQDGSLEGMGFLKDRQKASNPILLEGTTQVILRQVENTSRYVGFSVPVRNVNMIMSMQFKDAKQSVKSVLESKWGVTNEKIFQNIMQDIQTGRKEDQMLASAMNTLRGNFAGATLTANVGVAMKQAASFPTAAAELGFKPLAKALSDVGKSAKGKGLEELEAINPLLWYRAKGNSSADIAYAKQSDLYKMLPPMAKAISVDLIQNIDTFTVRTLEYASMYYVDDNFKELEKGSKKYWEKVSEVFTKTVERTQPNYTVLQRPEVLKTTNQLAKQLFMFKTQPLQNLGIIYDALGEWSQLRRNHASKADMDAALKKVQKALASQLIAALTFSAMTILANLGYHKWWKYDKDDDKDMTEEMLTAWATGTASTLSGMVVGGDYLYQFIDQLAFNGTNYGVEVSILEMINNTEAAIKNVQTYSMKLASAETEAEAEKYAKKLTANVEDLASLTAKYFGIPFDNIENTLLSPYLFIKDLVMGEAVGSTNVWWNESTDTQYLKMFDALVNGDMNRYSKLFNQQIKASEAKDPEANVKNNIKNMIRDSFNNQDMTAEEAIKALDNAGIEYEDDILEGWNYTAATGNTYTKYSKLKDAINVAMESKKTDDRKAIKEQIQALTKKGVDIGSIKSTITSTYKPIYLANQTADLQNLLITCYMYCGMTRDEAIKLIKNWK